MASLYCKVMPIKRQCLICNKEFETYEAWVRKGGGKTCSRACGIKARPSLAGEANPRWLGGKRHTKKGYIRVSIGRGNRRAEHILVMERAIGRRILTGENVHHINEIKSDNRIENLELLTVAEHARRHGIPEHGRKNFQKINEARRARARALEAEIK